MPAPLRVAAKASAQSSSGKAPESSGSRSTRRSAISSSARFHEGGVDALPEVTVSSPKQTRSNGMETGLPASPIWTSRAARLADASANVMPASWPEHSITNQMPDGRRKLTRLPPVTAPARIELAEILLEPAPTPFWRALRQIGVDRAVGVLPRHHFDWREARVDMPWDYVPLRLYQELLAEEGFSLDVIEDNPPMEAIRLGRPGREEEFEIFAGLVQNMGRLGIPVLCYNWAAVLSWLRTSSRLPGRGGAAVSGFDAALLEGAPLTTAGVVPSEDLVRNLGWFLERIVPIAEEAGVRLAMHPDDPPLPSVRGIDRIHSTVDGFRRLLEMNPSEVNGITLCQGNFTLMTPDVPDVIREFGEQKRIHFVHFRDVRGTAEHFVETFHDEGQTDMLACMQAYRDIGYTGVLRTDHVPEIAGDASRFGGYSDLARLHAIGYTQGLREAVYGRSPD
jgi:mannonate dehydratase